MCLKGLNWEFSSSRAFQVQEFKPSPARNQPGLVWAPRGPRIGAERVFGASTGTYEGGKNHDTANNADKIQHFRKFQAPGGFTFVNCALLDGRFFHRPLFPRGMKEKIRKDIDATPEMPPARQFLG